jgi:hypothetical protein
MGGVGAAPPPLASFFGPMSLSLVLADFGTLLFCFFLVVIFYSLSFLFLFHCTIYARASKLSKDLKRASAI